nr:MFS.2 [Starmerella bombicola]
MVDSNSKRSSSIRNSTDLSKYNVVPGKPFPPTPPNRDDYYCTFAHDDSERPINWPMWRRVVVKALASVCITFVVWGSAAIGPGLTKVSEEFHVGVTVAILCVSVYVFGFAAGPVFWGPSSEMFGRKLPLVVGMFGYMVFAFGCATAKDFQTLVLCRFFMGTFGCSTLVVGPSISADLFTVTQRGKAVSGVIFCLVAGPMVAPPVNAFTVNSYLGWRWSMYICGIMGALGTSLLVFLLEETYPQLVLKKRAQTIRRETGNWAVSAPIEDMELDTKEIMHRTVLKPMRLLLVEPVLLLLSLYTGFIYGVLYLCLEAVPYIFEVHYHFKGSIAYLPYFGMFIGAGVVVTVNLLFFDPMTATLIRKSGMDEYPEARVPLMMMCGIVFPMGIFLMCWSGAYHAHWIVPTIGAGLIGFGLIGIFQAILVYIIDAYIPVAASAIAANTFLRSAMGGAFPIFALQMFRNLGTQWAGTLLGCLAAVAAPAPFIFFFYGPQIRSRSKYALGDETDKEDLREESLVDPASDYHKV